MASNGSDSVLSEPPETSTSGPQQDQVNLRVTYLLTGNPRPPHPLGSLPVSTTIEGLKERIQAELPEHPSSAEQRLIYQGRPLLQNNATLREVLRLEPGVPVGPLPYTIHIVIQSRQPSEQQTPSTGLPQQPRAQHLSINAPSAAALGNGPTPTSLPGVAGTQPPSIPPANHVPHIPITQSAIAQAQATQMMLQNQLHLLQHQLALNNAGGAQGSVVNQNPQGGVSLSYQVHGQQPTAIHHGSAVPFGVLPPPFPGNMLNIPALLAEQQRLYGQNRQPGGHSHATAQNNSHPSQQDQTPGSSSPPSSQPPAGMASAATNETVPRVHEDQGRNGERRPIGSVELRHSGPGFPTLFPRPVPAPGQSSNGQPAGARATPQPSGAPAAQSAFLQRPSTQGPAGQHAPTPHHLLFPFPQHRATTQPSPGTMAWLLSSPNGPEALLFAPGHGYFWSARQPQQSQTLTRETTLLATSAASGQHVGESADQSQLHANEAATNRNADVDAGAAQIALRQQQALPAQGQNQQGDQEENDMFAFLIQRGWLFLRLYMFMFFLSDPGTWRRWLFLTIAIVVCILPRNNPLNDALALARRHIDNLLGPPQPQARRQRAAQTVVGRDGQQAQQNPSGNASARRAVRPGHVRGAVQMTPEEAAARLVRQHQDRNPNIIRDTLYRVEQAAALFLASLIPGVGERHVRAREEARREAQRAAEEERRAAQAVAVAEQQSQQEEASANPADPDSAGKVEGSAGASTAVESHGTNGEMRARTAEPRPVAGSSA